MWVNPLQIECKNILEVLNVVPLLPTLLIMKNLVKAPLASFKNLFKL